MTYSSWLLAEFSGAALSCGMASAEDTEANRQVQPFHFVDNTRLLQTSLSKYFNKPLFSDITVIGPDGRKLLCHQVVLSAGSKRFANMLEQGNLAMEELPVWGVDSDALQSIIEFFYSGECNLTFPGAVAVMDAANRLDVPSLSSAANTYVRGALSVHTATTILALALQYKLSELISACLSIISDNFVTVSATKDFNQASFETLKRILCHLGDNGKVPDETIFKAVWKWTISEPTHPNHFDAVLKLIRVPPSISFSELIQSSQQQGIQSTPATAAAAMAAAAAAASGAAPQQPSQPLPPQQPQQQPQQAQQQQSSPSQGSQPLLSQDGSQAARTDPAAPAPPPAPAAAAAAATAGSGGVPGQDPDEQPSRQQQQQQQSSSSNGAAAPGAAVRPEGLTIEVPEVKEPQGGVPQAPVVAASHQRTPGPTQQLLPLSGQPTPTSKALGGAAADSGMFVGPAGADMAAAAAAAGLDPLAMAAQAQMDPAFAAMYGGYPMAPARADGAAAADGSGGAGEGAAPVSPGKMAGWGPMGMMPGMQMGGMMPGFMPGMPMMGPMGPMMGPMMGMMPGYMSSGRNHAKGVCQVEGCNADLRGLRDYHLRYKICEYHLKVSSIIRDGVHQRFCQQCGRFHPLQDFDGAKRSCRARLLRHNARRRKRGEEELASMGYGNGNNSLKRTRGSFSQMPEVDDGSNTAAAAVAAGGYWPMMGAMGGTMDPYMAMAMGGMGGFAQDGSFNPAMMQYAQYGMMSPTGAMMPNPADAAAAAAGGDGEGSGRPGSKRGGSSGSEKGKEGGSDADWEEGEEEEGAQDEDRTGDEVAWAAAGLEMLADVAQARSSAAGDRSRAGSDAGGAAQAGAGQGEAGAGAGPGPGADTVKVEEGGDGDKQQQGEGSQGPQQAGQGPASSPPGPQEQEQQPQQQAEGAAAPAAGHEGQPAVDGGAQGVCAPVVMPLQLADSPSPQAAAGGLFVGRVSPGHDAPPTEQGADGAAATAAAAVSAGKGLSTPGASGAAAAACALGAAGDSRHRLSAAGGASSPGNDLAFRVDKPGAAAGTVKG